MKIVVRYRSVDGYGQRRQFASLAGAQRFAQKWAGEFPEIGSHYAVSGDGVGKIMVEGASLWDLFPGCVDPQAERDAEVLADWAHQQVQREADLISDYPPPEAYEIPRSPGCRCDDYQMVQVGCECGAERGCPPPPRPEIAPGSIDYDFPF